MSAGNVVVALFFFIVAIVIIMPDSGDFEVYDFQGTIEKKEIQRTSGVLFGTDEDYYFLLNTNNTSVVKEVTFETYLRHDVGDSYNYSLNNLTNKRELRELGAIP